ncbi:putative MFS family arabinose efflux permease [Antricoccus suffuscus]|uniref:Putative MFS family arabinose efflux permease n=1 Tax=Antricoccus suffuscus TaxID=1629062 RepID=A0A2T1A104_9ACTN|nr:MFS transporter [Antricoccus suffuscus]PRZ42285.1 putative MFS family arabinose efflux permease [Antricoccus suffuscus]
MAAARFPGRMVVAGCFITLMTTSGLSFYGLAVYLNAFSNERGWSLSSISLASTVFFVSSGVLGYFVAKLIARFDARRVMVAGAIVGAVALALLGQAHERWQLYLIYAVFAFGFGAAGLIPTTTVVTRWYQSGRAVALAVTSTGLSVGGMVLTPIAKWLSDAVGLAKASPILAIVWLVGTVPVIVFMIKPAPQAMGWLPDGAHVERNVVPPAPTGELFATAWRSRFFRSMTVAYVLIMAAQVGGLQQIVKLTQERAGPVAAAFATFAVAAMSVVARLAGGRMVNRLPMTAFAVGLGLTQGASLVLMAFSYWTWALFGTILVFGATIGNIVLMQSVLIGHHFGVRDYGRLFSVSRLFVVVGTAGGPFLLGWLYDVTGSYEVPYIIAGALSVSGAVVMSLAGRATEYRDDAMASELPVAGNEGG